MIRPQHNVTTVNPPMKWLRAPMWLRAPSTMTMTTNNASTPFQQRSCVATVSSDYSEEIPGPFATCDRRQELVFIGSDMDEGTFVHHWRLALPARRRGSIRRVGRTLATRFLHRHSL